MTTESKITMVKALVGNDSGATDDVVSVYLDAAEDAIMHRRYPSGYDDDYTMPMKYDILQCKLAARYFLRRGAEGEILHSENGINRTYNSVNDSDLLSEVMQVVKL